MQEHFTINAEGVKRIIKDQHNLIYLKCENMPVNHLLIFHLFFFLVSLLFQLKDTIFSHNNFLVVNLSLIRGISCLLFTELN